MITAWSVHVDYRDDLYPKIPFYMAYPAQNMYLTEMEYEKDMELMKSYYPKETEAIMKLVESRLDELAYEGSRIYDEEPDRLMIQMEIDRLSQKLQNIFPQENMQEPRSYFEMVPMSITGGNHKEPGRDCRDNWLCSMVAVLFSNELYQRRCRHRRCNRWW
jgi:hypothetical protein